MYTHNAFFNRNVDSEHVNYSRYGEAQPLHQGPNGQYRFVVGRVAERVQGLVKVYEKKRPEKMLPRNMMKTVENCELMT